MKLTFLSILRLVMFTMISYIYYSSVGTPQRLKSFM